jgi:hypothetical protein
MSKITAGMRVTTTQARCNLFPGDAIPPGDFVAGRDEDTEGTVYLYRWGTSSGGWQVNASSCTPVPTYTYIDEVQNLPPLPTFDLKKAGQPFFSVDRGVAKPLCEDDLHVTWKLAGEEPKKGWTFNVPLDEVDGMRILRELDEAGAKYAEFKHDKGYTTHIVHEDILEEFPGLGADVQGPITKVGNRLDTYDQSRHGPPTKWYYVSKYGAHNTFEKLKAAIEGARKAKREASKVRVTVEYGV